MSEFSDPYSGFGWEMDTRRGKRMSEYSDRMERVNEVYQKAIKMGPLAANDTLHHFLGMCKVDLCANGYIEIDTFIKDLERSIEYGQVRPEEK